MLLDASRVSIDRIEPKRELVDPADIINSAVARRRRQISGRSLELEIAEDLPFVFVDGAMIEQALIQIVDNAGKYSPPSSRIRIEAKADNGYVALAVTDQGAGFNTEEYRHASERFFRGSRHVGVSGSGLGLWIAKAFLVANNGRLIIASAGESRGTTVTVLFPAARHASANLAAVTAYNDD